MQSTQFTGGSMACSAPFLNFPHGTFSFGFQLDGSRQYWRTFETDIAVGELAGVAFDGWWCIVGIIFLFTPGSSFVWMYWTIFSHNVITSSPCATISEKRHGIFIVWCFSSAYTS
jgi:hypothetical protein